MTAAAVFGVAKLVAPAVAVTSAGTSERQPIDLVCVVDKSGSMQGEKIELLRETLEFVTRQLGDADRFSIVQFSSRAEVVTGLVRMTAGGKERTLNSIKELHADGGTDS